MSRRVALFLGERAESHAGSERISDLLCGDHEILPAREAASDDVIFVNRAAIVVARVDPSAEAGGEPAFTLPSEHEVSIHLTDGTVISGVVSFLPPPDRARLVDFLNDAPLFLRVHEAGRISLVNQR